LVLLDGGSKVILISNKRSNKSEIGKILKTNDVFNFSIKVSGNSIFSSEFNYLTCSGDTTLNLIVLTILKTTISPECKEENFIHIKSHNWD
jgi:hypothetical protein